MEACEESAKEEATQEESNKSAWEETNGRSVFVGNVHFSASTEELRALFKGCGKIERVTIPVDFRQHPKGYAYVEFSEAPSVLKAQVINNQHFKGRKLTVLPKKTGILASVSKLSFSRRSYFFCKSKRAFRFLA